jgi:hypothetical protein
MNVAELESLVLQQGRRIATLETELAALKAGRVGKIAQASTVAPRAEEAEEGVRVFYPVDGASIALPGAADLEKLIGIVAAKYPKLLPSKTGRYAFEDSNRFFEEVRAGFAFVAARGRSDEVDEKRSLGWWIDAASEWCRLQNTTSRVTGSALLVAALASGDVDYVEGDEFGNVWSFALEPYSGGRVATEAWRSVLNGRQLRKPRPGKHRGASSP